MKYEILWLCCADKFSTFGVLFYQPVDRPVAYELMEAGLRDMGHENPKVLQFYRLGEGEHADLHSDPKREPLVTKLIHRIPNEEMLLVEVLW